MGPTETSTRAAALLCVLLAAVSAGPEITVYGKLGDEVVLKPGNSSVPTSIEWKQDGNLAAQWREKEKKTDLYRQFKVRGSLDTSNGEMTITGLTRNESGSYTLEINEHHLQKIQLVVIPPVPKPTVSQRCDPEAGVCVLSCDGDVADAAPVTYAWSTGDAAASKELRLAKEEGSSGVKEFHCELRNPVSREISGPVANPFLAGSKGSTATEQGPKFSTGGVVFGGLLAAVLLLAGAHRCIAGMWFFQKNSMPWEKNFWRKHERQHVSASNSTSVQENGQSDEEIPLPGYE